MQTKMIVTASMIMASFASGSQASTITVNSKDTVAIPKLIDEVTRNIVSVGEYDIKQPATDQNHCAYEIALTPKSFKLDYKRATNVSVNGQIGGDVLIASIALTGTHATVTTTDQSLTVNVTLPVSSAAHQSLMPDEIGVSGLDSNATALRKAVQNNIRELVSSDHTIQNCVKTPTSFDISNSIQVGNTVGGSATIVWIFKIGGGGSVSGTDTATLTTTYQFKSFEYVRNNVKHKAHNTVEMVPSPAN